MLPTYSTDPQLGPALALVALRKEFPFLPAAKAVILEDGHLELTVGSRDAFDLFHQVLGGEPRRPFTYAFDGGLREAMQLLTQWRDVDVTLLGRWNAVAVPVRPAVSLVRAA